MNQLRLKRSQLAALGVAALMALIGFGILAERSPSLQALHDRFTGTGRYAKSGRFASTGEAEAIRMGALDEMRDLGMLRRGMARSEVAQLLGEPYTRFPEGGPDEQWRYSLSGGGLGIDFTSGRTTKFIRWFESDHPMKAEEW